MCGISVNPLPGTEQAKGFTFLELMVAATVFVVGVIGLMAAISSATMVESAAQEHNLALDGAREVIERVRSEGFAALEARTQALAADPIYAADIPVDPDASDEANATARNRNNRNSQANGNAAQAAARSTSTSAQDDDGSALSIASWYDIPPEELGNCTAIDADGSFDVTGLTAWDDDPDGKVGKVTLKQIDDDRAEITVTVRWQGRHGKTQIALRCRIPDWKRFDAR